jgi:acetoin utilization deacetylase AcuC-like enzyme/ankyrin repeat protein
MPTIPDKLKIGIVDTSKADVTHNEETISSSVKDSKTTAEDVNGSSGFLASALAPRTELPSSGTTMPAPAARVVDEPTTAKGGASGKAIAIDLTKIRMNEVPVESVMSPKTKKLVINPDIRLNERDEDENTALHIAIHARKLAHAKFLLEAGASVRTRCDGSLPIHTAISMGGLKEHAQFAYECVVLLRDHGADLAAKDDAVHTPLFLACMFNLPQVASFILSDKYGLATLNLRADRAGNRPLHAAAKFDTSENASVSKRAASIAMGQIDLASGVTSFSVVDESQQGGLISTDNPASGKTTSIADALLTQVLLGTTDIEVDAVNVIGQTPLHIACMRRNWPVARLLLQAGASATIVDRRGLTPGQWAYKRGMPIPNDLLVILGDPPDKGVVAPARELIVDPDGSTLLLGHELCLLHRTCVPIRRDSPEPPPENVRRLQVLLDKDTGILHCGEFACLVWNQESRRASIADVLKVNTKHNSLDKRLTIPYLYQVHEYMYVEKLTVMTAAIPDHPNAIAHLDGDTAISKWSFEAAMRAAGSVCEAVVLAEDGIRNAFCPVRPPGHHAGPRGIVRCANDPEGGSHGFCLLNNVCIGAAYARSMYRHEGIQKVAIIDFDVHHGNGTEAIIRNLIPSVEKATIRTPFAVGEISTSSFRPWLDETDIQNVFFSSTHGYGNRGYEQPGWFYPASGKSYISEAISRPSTVDKPGLSDFILSQTWSRMGEEAQSNFCKIINVGLELPHGDGDQQARYMKQRLDLRDSYRKQILPALREFDPDLIFISAGFDAHRKDTMNFGYVGMVEDDYEWVTEQLIKVANTCCNGRVISVLEGGYKIHGGIVSPFARSVASHVRALVDGGRSRELYDAEDCQWESQFERNLYERREKKKDVEREQLRQFAKASRRALNECISGNPSGEPEDPGAPEDPDAPPPKRKRPNVNYQELYKKMKEEGFGN